MTRARTPRPHEIDDARRDERLLRALREGGRDPAWRTRGVCQSVDPEMFFPAPSEPADAAIELCRSCPVQGACLAWALRFPDLHGVWGGTTARERRAMAVVWRGGGHGPGAATDPAELIGAGIGSPVGPGPGANGGSPAAPVPASRSPAARAASLDGSAADATTELTELGAAMDRAQLLRLVHAR